MPLVWHGGLQYYWAPQTEATQPHAGQGEGGAIEADQEEEGGSDLLQKVQALPSEGV